MSDRHAWFRARLDAFFLGLLEEEEQSRFEEHAASCTTCGAAMKAFGEHLPSQRSEHIPARIIARWDRARRKLRGAPRRLVREHLESCAACRQDLEAIGFSPVLVADPDLEEEPLDRDEDDPSSASEVQALVAPTLAAQHPILIVQRGGATSSRRAWLLGGAGGAALAASVLLVLLPVVTRDRASVTPSHSVSRPPIVDPPVAPSKANETMLSVLGRAAALSAPTRGAADPSSVIRIDDDTRFVHVTLPDLYLPDSTRLAIEVHGPDGLVTEGDAVHGELARGRTLLIGNANRRLTPGRYRIRIFTTSEPTGTPVELQFRLDGTAGEATRRP